MNGACIGHHTVLMHSMLDFAQQYGWFKHWENHLVKEQHKKHLLPSMPLPSIDVDALCRDSKENLKLEQIWGTHLGAMDLLGNPGNPLYAEPLSMAEFFDIMIVGTHHIGDLPKQNHCKDADMTIHVYEDERCQVSRKSWDA